MRGAFTRILTFRLPKDRAWTELICRSSIRHILLPWFLLERLLPPSFLLELPLRKLLLFSPWIASALACRFPFHKANRSGFQDPELELPSSTIQYVSYGGEKQKETTFLDSILIQHVTYLIWRQSHGGTVLNHCLLTLLSLSALMTLQLANKCSFFRCNQEERYFH